MAQVTLEFDARTRSFVRRLAKLGEGALYDSLETLFQKQATRTAARVTKRMLSGRRLRRRTGTLARSVTGHAVRVRGVPGFRVGIFRGPALAYARAQELGANITPKRAKALAMPVEGGPAVTPAGVERYGGPRNFPGGLTFIPFKTGGNVVGGLYREEDLAGGVDLREVKAAYLLLNRVRIKAKFFLRDGVRQELPRIVKEIGKFVAKAMVKKS